MISDERLQFKLRNPDICTGDEIEMAKELTALRKNRIDGIEVAAGVYTILGISGYHPSSTGCAQQKLMSKAGKVIHQAKEDGVEFDWYARWMD